jgi:hypothetical protein
MASFDLETFLRVQNQGGGAFEALGASFGIPNCLLDLGKEALSILPTSILADVTGQVKDARDLADSVTKEIVKKIMLDTGIIEFDTETGRLKFRSDSTRDKLDNDTLQVLKNLSGALQAFAYASQFGAQLYANFQSISNQFALIEECFDKFEQLQKFQSGNSANQKQLLSPAQVVELEEKKYALDKVRYQNAIDFMNKCDSFIATTNEIVYERSLDPTLEPKFSDSTEFDQFLDGTTFERVPVDELIQGGRRPQIGTGAGTEIEAEEDIFRLEFGPPISTRGYFLLTKDGLYYDSQKGGLDPILLSINPDVIPDGDRWKYNFDPNIGGKGTAITFQQYQDYKDTLFDPDKIDESRTLLNYYEQDHFLQNLIQQRDKQVYDLSSALTDEIALNGESSVSKNMRLSLASELSYHNFKIRKRKKQIEIAVKAPNVFESKVESPKIFQPGQIPINDFSYLNDYDFAIEFDKQRRLMFTQGDLEGIILPIQARFTSSPIKRTEAPNINLTVPEIGIGSIIYENIDPSSSTMLSLTDIVVTDKLFAIYNLLQPKVVQPSSNEFFMTNTVTNNKYNNLQLVSNFASSVYFSGLSIPYLEGITKNKSSSPTLASGLGSYLRLPDTREYREYMYNPDGFTFECWVHVPNLLNAGTGWLSATASSLTKVLLANENVGLKEGSSPPLDELGNPRDLDFLPISDGDSYTKGVVIGFTRDRRITKEGLGYSNNNSNNNPQNSLSFFIAPTQSKDASSCSWINKANCNETESFYKMKVDCSTTVNGKSFGQASSTFVLVNISCDPKTDTIKMYCDGELMATSAVSEVFGVQKYGTPDLPSFKKRNSFEYQTSSVDGPRSLKAGPKLNTFYTPWIVGGGYTDGMYLNGNFMGGDRGGITSGLRGHIGSLKFYAKPLDSNEALKNYKAQSVYFKNILT